MVTEIAETYEITVTDIELIKRLCLPYKITSVSMGISQTALSTKIWRLCAKLGVENQRALIIKVLELGIVDLSDFTYREYDGKDTS